MSLIFSTFTHHPLVRNRTTPLLCYKLPQNYVACSLDSRPSVKSNCGKQFEAMEHKNNFLFKFKALTISNVSINLTLFSMV